MKSTAEIVAAGEATISRNYAPQPLVMDHGLGVRVWDTEGREYLDFLGGLAVCTLGHAHPALVEAVAAQVGRLTQVSNAFWTAPQVELQRRLVELSFADRVFLANCGATANEAAIKLARRYQRVVRKTPRFEIITFEGGFHGRTYGALSATAQPKYHAGFEPMVPGFVTARFNDLASVEAVIGAHTAAILVEPVQGEGGVRPAAAGFLEGLRGLCDEHGLVLILDEVQTGIGRTGRFFGYEHAAVRPDVLTLAKGLGGGIPIGAMLSTDELSRGFERGSHATTFGGNALSAAAGVAVLEVIEREGLLARAEATGARLRHGLAGCVAAGLGTEVRGVGQLNALDLGDAAWAARAVVEARGRGLLLNTAGATSLRLVPALVATDDDVDRAVAIVEAAVRAARGA